MAIALQDLEYLYQRGFLRPGIRLLDIGSQNLLHLTPEMTAKLIGELGGNPGRSAAEIDRICASSIMDGTTRTTYLSEFINLTSISYTSFDVSPGLQTDIFDLNFDNLPRKYRGEFDLVLNNGTTEHVINQFNAMKVIHEALKVDGVAVHYVPSTGWAGHGYFCYHEEFFTDLAASNRYAVEDLWYCRTGSSWFDSSQFDFRNPMNPGISGSGTPSSDQNMVPSSNVYAAMRKIVEAPFRVKLELATSHAGADASIVDRYQSPPSKIASLMTTLFRR